jgi:hypothetical protein
MLSWAARFAAITAIACLSILLNPAVARADHEVYCPPGGGDCIVKAHKPRQPGTPGDSGGGGGGGSSDPDPCMYELASPQPPAGHSAWEGHAPGDGAVYVRICTNAAGETIISLMWAASPPGNTLTPAILAAQAVKRLPIKGPDIGIAPDGNGSGLVGLPVWMWTAVTPSTWGPSSATAAVPGLSVTATARAQKIVWTMGDGATITCTAPGTPYQPEFGNRRSPDCGYDGYSTPSSTRPGGRYPVTGTTTWQVTWVGGGQSGALTVTRSSTTTIDIDELQVVTS